MAVTVGGLLALSACGRPYDLQCGPLAKTDCLDHANLIVEALAHYHPWDAVSSIEFLHDERHAFVILDDGTEIGWGERQRAS